MEDDVDFYFNVNRLWEAGDFSKDRHIYLSQEESDLHDSTERESIRWALKLLCYKRMAKKVNSIH